MVQRELSHALLNKDVLARIHERFGSVKGLFHWMQATLDIAQKYQLVDNSQAASAMAVLSKLDAEGYESI